MFYKILLLYFQSFALLFKRYVATQLIEDFTISLGWIQVSRNDEIYTKNEGDDLVENCRIQ